MILLTDKILKAKIVVSLLCTVWISLLLLWLLLAKSLELLWHFVFGIVIIEFVILLLGGLFYALRVSKLDTAKSPKIIIWLIPSYITFGIGLYLLNLNPESWGPYVFFILVIFIVECILVYAWEKRIRRKGERDGLWGKLWINLSRSQKGPMVAILIIIPLLVSGIFVVLSGIITLNTTSTGYYPSINYPEPQITNYTVSSTNITFQINVTHEAFKEEFVVGEYIKTEVTLTAIDVNESLEEPFLESVIFPDNDEWDFRYYRVGSYEPGSQLGVYGYRVYPNSGSHNFTQQWIIIDGLGNNHTMPIYLNLTIYSREAIEPFEKERERIFEQYMQLYVLQRQEGFNLIVVGFSIILVATFVPQMANLIVKLTEGANLPSSTKRNSQMKPPKIPEE